MASFEKIIQRCTVNKTKFTQRDSSLSAIANYGATLDHSIPHSKEKHFRSNTCFMYEVWTKPSTRSSGFIVFDTTLRIRKSNRLRIRWLTAFYHMHIKTDRLYMKYFSSLQTPNLNAKPENTGDFNDTSIWKLVQELSAMQKAYQQITGALPRGKLPFWSLVDN